MLVGVSPLSLGWEAVQGVHSLYPLQVFHFPSEDYRTSGDARAAKTES